MDWQEITALAIVCAAAILLVRKFIKKQKRGFSGDCCSSASQPKGSITYSIKKGERPKILIKM
ncbi:MAG: FeoB-associated Cys-rich membrane protein [Verrucomicrobiia bacterium]|jgi:hypothetical protein